MIELFIGVDHRVDISPQGDVMCFVPLLLGEQILIVLDLLNNDCFSTPIKHNNAQ